MASTSAHQFARGEQVRLLARRHGLSEFGLVTAVGDCDYRRCPHGDECITVALHTPTGGVMTVNVTADQIEVLP